MAPPSKWFHLTNGGTTGTSGRGRPFSQKGHRSRSKPLIQSTKCGAKISDGGHQSGLGCPLSGRQSGQGGHGHMHALQRRPEEESLDVIIIGTLCVCVLFKGGQRKILWMLSSQEYIVDVN
uniref:Uncharacterized protein n=1 Tax=Solanum lycopersicum TaxID=4081 RepID=A0A3Q7HKL9_SOLLC